MTYFNVLVIIIVEFHEIRFIMRVCFIGHRNINNTEDLIFLIENTALTLINKGVTTFLFGSKSEFNDLSWEIVTKLKQTHPFIKRIYVRSTFQYIDKFYEEYLLESYEETYFPPKLENAGRYSYVERNCEMIDQSDYCVFYYNENYVPPLKRQSKRITISPLKRNSGTKIAYNYAKKKKKEIINLYK